MNPVAHPYFEPVRRGSSKRRKSVVGDQSQRVGRIGIGIGRLQNHPVGQ